MLEEDDKCSRILKGKLEGKRSRLMDGKKWVWMTEGKGFSRNRFGCSGSSKPPVQWARKLNSLRVKRPGLQAYHSPVSSAEVINACINNFSSQCPFTSCTRNTFMCSWE